MLRVMFQKLWHKKWMNFCLLLGCVIMTATVVSFPLYEQAAYNRMLQDEFDTMLFSEGNWPARSTFMEISRHVKNGTSIQKLEKLLSELNSKLGVTGKNQISYYYLDETEAIPDMKRDDVPAINLSAAFMSDLPAHTSMLSGEMYSDSGYTEDGAIEVVINEACMVNRQLLLGDTLTFSTLTDVDGNPIRFFVKGVFQEDDNADYYWQTKPDDMKRACFMNETVFRSLFTGKNAGNYNINCFCYSLFEYEDLPEGNAESIVKTANELFDKSEYKNMVKDTPYRAILEEYILKRARIRATLIILQIPVMIMLVAFLFMISGQMYEMERNEISVIKSRGSSGVQILRLYFYQSLVLSVTGGILGIPLGMFFSKMLGQTRCFLEFDGGRVLNVVFDREALIYTLCSMAAVLLILTLPAIKHSRVSIVHLKQQKAAKKKSLWEKLFLDVILLGVSLYGYYNFSRNSDKIAESVLMGNSLDPLLYISSSLFILGLGLLFLRIQPYLVKLIYTIGKRFWKPASYASFMENIKNGKKQQFIMLFLILTISLGMYHATVARTIYQNAATNADYLDGADVILKEVWTDNSLLVARDKSIEFVYYEPDYSKYASITCAKKYTRVIRDDLATVSTKSSGNIPVTLMGIHTKDFGTETNVSRDLLPEHYYTYLNELAVHEDGLLVSENFHSKMGYEIGDSLSFGTNHSKAGSGKIVGFVPYFPGYAPSSSYINSDGTLDNIDNYLVVTHYDKLRQSWGATPYEIWIQLKDNADLDEIDTWVEEKDVKLKKYIVRQDDIQKAVEDPLLQGTNGILTMEFIVTILLCAVGYLIYWIMSVKSRELMFGVLRACGMHRSELIHMLLNEQIFSGVFSILAGIGIGRLTSELFVPIVQMAYASSSQVLPMQMIINTTDMLRLYGVILLVIIISLGVLIGLLFKLNITNTLKLGEE